MQTARLLVVVGLLALGTRPALAQTLDPTFTAPTAYAAGTVYSTLEQPDGKRLVNGAFLRINGTPVNSRLVRFNADGSLDNAFLQNVGAATAVQRMHLLSNGQVLLVGFGGSATTAGGVSRNGGLLRLNADGTGDASFDAGSGPTSQLYSVTYLDDAASLPNGKVVAVGPFDHFNGAVANNIVGLNANGTLDPSFNAGTGADGEILTIVVLPSGKLLIGGYFSTYNGFNCDGLARLNADGSFDTSFTATTNGSVENITVQPDGKILATGTFYPTATTSTGLIRLNANGTPDNTFTAPTQGFFLASYYGDAMRVQADGKIVVIGGGNSSSPYLARLNANGTLDATYQVGSGPNIQPLSLTALANGGTLVAGNFSDFNGTLDRTLIQLTGAGAIDATFQPKIQTNAGIYAAVRQADGKYLIGGTFTEINGLTARRLARLNADGSLDQQYGYNSGGLDMAVNDIVLQNGMALVATDTKVRRYQSTGASDNTYSAGTALGTVNRLMLQPDGRLLVGGTFTYYNNRLTGGLIRLDPAGNYDASFAPVTTGTNYISQFHSMALQPDGKLLVAAYARGTSSSSSRVMRLLANGTVDASFTALPLTNASGANSSSYRANALVLQPDGKVLLGGAFAAVGGTARANVARLNIDGTLDGGFVPPATAGAVFSLALQPNNRVLVGGSFTSATLPANLARLNADGTADASFAASAGPNGAVRNLLVQADGAIVVGGSFSAYGGQPAYALARITAPNVLHAALPQAVADRTQAWPVPARTTLHVSLDPAARAQTLELLDVLGRPVRRQALGTAPDATVAVDGLPAGQYLLRVHYAQGTVARRVSVQ